MTVQKFQVGDVVAVRPFTEIDIGDIGGLQVNSTHCFGIDVNHIDTVAKDGFKFQISDHDFYGGSHVYSLQSLTTGNAAAYSWAQGMLYGLLDCADTGEVDAPEEDLMGFLFDGGAA